MSSRLTLSIACSAAEGGKDAKTLVPETSITAKEATEVREAPEKPAAAKNGSKAAVPARSKEDKTSQAGDTKPK